MIASRVIVSCNMGSKKAGLHFSGKGQGFSNLLFLIWEWLEGHHRGKLHFEDENKGTNHWIIAEFQAFIQC